MTYKMAPRTTSTWDLQPLIAVPRRRGNQAHKVVKTTLTGTRVCHSPGVGTIRHVDHLYHDDDHRDDHADYCTQSDTFTSWGGRWVSANANANARGCTVRPHPPSLAQTCTHTRTNNINQRVEIVSRLTRNPAAPPAPMPSLEQRPCPGPDAVQHAGELPQLRVQRPDKPGRRGWGGLPEHLRRAAVVLRRHDRVRGLHKIVGH